MNKMNCKHSPFNWAEITPIILSLISIKRWTLLQMNLLSHFSIRYPFQKKETEDAIENLLTHLEEFCGLIEMIRNDSNICLEEAIGNISKKAETMNKVYEKIDRLEDFVGVVKQCVDDMDKEVTKAEQLFGDTNNNRVKKFFSAFISNTSKQNNRKSIDAKYEPKEIFRSSDYIKSLDSETIPQDSDQTQQTSDPTVPTDS